MQVKGQDIVAVIELGRYPGIALAVKKDRMDKIKTIADLKGAKIGVTAPGSSTNMIVWYLMAKAGLKPDDASFVGVGAGAVGDRRHPEGRDRRHLQHRSGDRQAGVDRRRRGPGRDAHDGGHHQGVRRHRCRRPSLYMKRDFIEKNPNTVQALVNAFYKTLKWLDKATPEQIADNVPQEYWLGDKPLYIAAVKANLQIYSRDGIVSDGSQKRSLDFLRQFDKEIAAAKIDTAKTFDGRFVKKAAETVK